AVHDHLGRFHGSVPGEQLLELFVRDIVTQVANIQLSCHHKLLEKKPISAYGARPVQKDGLSGRLVPVTTVCHGETLQALLSESKIKGSGTLYLEFPTP